jgi:xylan 1,4-beta-xylosidase
MYYVGCLSLLALSFGQPLVDLQSKAAPFKHYWKNCVGSGHMLLGTRADWQEHLIRAKNELGFTGIRGHGWLDDDMSVLKAAGQYNFFNVDTVLDFLVKNSMKPVFELSFMPKVLAGCSGDECAYAFNDPGGYKGLIMPPKNYTQWEDLLRTLGHHLVERYGLDEVSSWRFEVWNEMWGIKFPDPYMQLFSHSVAALKSVSPKLRVGGPATMQCLYVKEFVDNCTASNISFDFVSTHLYPSDPECGINDVSCFTRMITTARDYVRSHSNAEFLITEWNAGLALPENLNLDTHYSAAFIFHSITTISDVDAFSWWTFTDIFEEGWMTMTEFDTRANYGLQTLHGVPKPSWRAFELLNKAGTWQASVSGAAPQTANSPLSVLATLDAEDPSKASQLLMFVADWKPASTMAKYACNNRTGRCDLNPSGAYSDWNLCGANCHKDDSTLVQGSAQIGNVSITLKHGTQGLFGGAPVEASLVRIDEKHANPKALWKARGSKQYMTEKEIEDLKVASQFSKEEPLTIQHQSQGTSLLTFDLPAFSVVRILITRKATPEESIV